MSFSIVNPQQYKFLPEGIKVSVVRMNAGDVVHGVALDDMLYKIIEGDAKTHSAKFNSDNFRKVLDAIRNNKIQAHFAIVEGENYSPRFGGGAIQFPTVFTLWNGHDFEYYPAIYSEDTYILPEVSTEFRERTKGNDSPAGIGLGTYLTQEIIKLSVSGKNENMPFGTVSGGRLSESASDNKPIISILNKLGATVGSEGESAVLEFGGTPNLKNRQMTPVQTDSLASRSGGGRTIIRPNVFVTSWSGDNGNQRIVASFTEAISTFSGEPVVRVQITTNGNIPSGEFLKDILDSLVFAGQEEILERQWVSKSMADVLSSMRIHVLDEPKIVSALKTIGAKPRMLGVRTMLPIALNYAKIPAGAVNFEIPSAKPFTKNPVSANRKDRIPLVIGS